MILFTIDTSGKHGTLALAQREGGAVRVLASESMAGGQYSAELIPKLAAMLERLGKQKTDLGAIAVVAGPGSFTGLRVGLAAAKGLAETLKTQLVALSALELVAAGAAEQSGHVVAAIDAGRSEIFLANCELHPKLEVRTTAELLVKQAEVAARAREMGGRLVTADAKLAAFAENAGVAVKIVPATDAGRLAALGFALLERGVTVRPDDLDANYIRRSDAEILSAPFL